VKISFENRWIMSFSIDADELPLKMSSEDFTPYSADDPRKIGGVQILKDKPIELIKWWKAGSKNLLVSTCITRRIRNRAIRDYQIGECQNSPYQFKGAVISRYRVSTSKVLPDRWPPPVQILNELDMKTQLLVPHLFLSLPSPPS